jgi:hypothetical protein
MAQTGSRFKQCPAVGGTDENCFKGAAAFAGMGIGRSELDTNTAAGRDNGVEAGAFSRG